MTKSYRTKIYPKNQGKVWDVALDLAADLDLHEAKVDVVAVWDGKTVTEGVIKIREGGNLLLPFSTNKLKIIIV